MSKLKLVLVIIVLAMAGGYWFTYQTNNTSLSSGEAASTLLNRVPADTVLFIGGLETMPFVNLFDEEQTKALQTSIQDQVTQLEKVTGGNTSPAGKVLAQLYMELANHFYLGRMTELNDFAVYTLGVYPVAIWKSTDLPAFTNRLDVIEKENQISPRHFKLGNAQLREYEIDKNSTTKLYIAINDNVVSIGAAGKNETVLKLLAGVDFPKQSLANNHNLQNLKSAHRLLPFGLGYIDIHTALQNLTSNDSNLLKLTLQEVAQDTSTANFEANRCYHDASKIAARWPRILFGYRQLDVKSDPILADATMIFEHTDTQFLTTLKNISGVLPEFSFEHDLISFGIGINVDNIASFINDFRTDILNETYQCDDLLAIQQQAREANPGMLTMGTQMVSGVQGVSIHLTKMNLVNLVKGDTNNLEGMAVITARNPKNLIMAASTFYPPLNQLNLEPNGESKALTLPMGVTANIAMSSNALTLQFGEADEVKNRIAQIHQGKTLSSSFMRNGMNLSAYLNLLKPMLTEESKKQMDPKEVEQIINMMTLIEKLNIKFVSDIEVEDKGIALNLTMSMQSAKKN